MKRAVNPSPEEIAAECAAIRTEWSDAEHRARAGQDRDATWMPPMSGFDRGREPPQDD